MYARLVAGGQNELAPIKNSCHKIASAFSLFIISGDVEKNLVLTDLTLEGFNCPLGQEIKESRKRTATCVRVNSTLGYS